MQPVIETVNPADLDRLAAPEADAEPDRLDPATLVDVWSETIPLRLGVIRFMVPALPDNSCEMAEALAELSQMGNQLAAAGRDETVRPSGLVDRLRKLHRRLGQVEELVLRSVFRAVKDAEERGEVQ